MDVEREKKQRKRRSVEHWQIVSAGLLLYDALAVNLAYFLALWLRFDCMYSAIPQAYLSAWLRFAPLYTPVCLAVFWLFRLYQSVWRFASLNEMMRAVMATAVAFVVHTAGITVLEQRMPITYYCVGILLQFMLTIGVRYSYRFVLLLKEAQAGGGIICIESC